jgi:predicted DNA-binding transcriptional regulator YafY
LVSHRLSSQTEFDLEQRYTYAQRQRLSYIDFKLFFTGILTRAEIVSHFQLGVAAATRDINYYKQEAPENVFYDHKQKCYFISDEFEPLFAHDPRKTLIKLANQISDGFDPINSEHFSIESPRPLNIPDIHVVAKLSQAILRYKAAIIIYNSLSSGSKSCVIIPHSIVDNGLQWHVRASDQVTKSFRDFVLTRITNIKIEDQSIKAGESKTDDQQWNRLVPMRIIPHPNNVSFTTAIALDYAMENNILLIETRAALAGYLLKRLNVDCTEDASLAGAEYQLWLENQTFLFGAENLSIALGYKVENDIFI